MISVIISILLLLGCLVIIGIIVGRKMTILTSIDTSILPEERARTVKNKIIADRIERKLHTARKMASVVTLPLSTFRKNLGHKMGAIQKGVLELREKQRRAAVIGGANATNSEPERKQEVASSLLEQAQELVNADRFVDAEKRYIDIISLDSNNLEAYEGLAELYMTQKEWAEASEVLEYLCKKEREGIQITPAEELGQLPARFAKHLYELSEVHQMLDNHERALEEILEAVSLDKNNPKLLDALVEMYIFQKQRLRAERALEQLRRANPDNNKLDDLSERIAELSY